jgi:hypothetical protein
MRRDWLKSLVAVGVCGALGAFFSYARLQRHEPRVAPRATRGEPRSPFEPTQLEFATLGRVGLHSPPVASTVVPSESPDEVPESEPSPEDCSLCLRSVCSDEVEKGGDAEAALCLLSCERSTPREICLSGSGPNPIYPNKAPPVSFCPGFARTPATIALVDCGKACPCPWHLAMSGTGQNSGYQTDWGDSRPLPQP